MNRIRAFASTLQEAPAITAHLTTLRAEMRLIARYSSSANLVRTWVDYGLASKRYLPISLAPLLDPTLINAGIAVGWHTPPPSLMLSPATHHQGNRFLMGNLIYQAKNYNDQYFHVGDEQIHTFSALAICALAPAAFAKNLDVIVAVPSSRHTNTLPHRLAEHIASMTFVPMAPKGALRFHRPTGQSKETNDYWAKRDLMDGSMVADSTAVAGKSLLIIDDICKYGATFLEAARACKEAGAMSVSVLTLSKTYTCQRIPERMASRSSRVRRFSDNATGAAPPTAIGFRPSDNWCGFPEEMDEVPIP